MSDDDNLLSRWSRRKRAVKQEDEAPPQEAEIAAPVEESDEDEAVILARLDLPVPESLKAGDDFTPFMHAAVPEFLRKRALRVLWRSNPVLACVDGLNDYDDDFTSPELTQKVLATSYKVGKGIVREILKADPEAEEAATDEAEEQELLVVAEVAMADEAVRDVGPEEHTLDDAPFDQSEQAFRPRRMTFQS